MGPFMLSFFHFTARQGKRERIEPCPGWDSTEMVPPCRSTIFLQIASPMPVPANSSRLCSRWNMPKILSKYLRVNSQSVVFHRKHRR